MGRTTFKVPDAPLSGFWSMGYSTADRGNNKKGAVSVGAALPSPPPSLPPSPPSATADMDTFVDDNMKLTGPYSKKAVIFTPPVQASSGFWYCQHPA